MAKKQQITFCLIIFIGIIYYILTHCEVLPEAFLSNGIRTQYFLDLASIALGIGGTFLAASLYHFKGVREDIAKNGETAYYKWGWVRLALTAAAVLGTLFIYLASTHSDTAQYSFLIALIGALFCWPYTYKNDTEGK